MVFREEQPFRPVGIFTPLFFQGIADNSFLKQFILQPDGQRSCKTPESKRGKRQIRFQQALELQEGLIVEDDIINIGGTQACFVQAILDSIRRITRIMLPAGESFLLSGGDNLPL